MPEPLIIVGASARAAAFSALRAGISPACVDLFADRDLARCCPVIRVRPYPGGVPRAVARLPAGPVMYTGAMENYPLVLSTLMRRRTLWGNGPEVLKGIRDPHRLAFVLGEEGIAFPETLPVDADVPRDETWLVKAPQSGGGSGVATWGPGQKLPNGRGRPFFQKKIEGDPCSGLYVGAGGRAVFLGASRQQLASHSSNHEAFQYSGSIGPLELTAEARRRFEHIGEVVARRFDVVGVFGVDMMLQDETPWVIEVNPRYPASAEILELSSGQSVVGMHCAACRDAQLPEVPTAAAQGRTGKMILFAREHVTIPGALVALAESENAASPHPLFADLPAPQSTIRRGTPVLTILATGEDEARTEEALLAASGRIEAVLYDDPGFQRRPASFGA